MQQSHLVVVGDSLWVSRDFKDPGLKVGDLIAFNNWDGVGKRIISEDKEASENGLWCLGGRGGHLGGQ